MRLKYHNKKYLKMGWYHKNGSSLHGSSFSAGNSYACLQFSARLVYNTGFKVKLKKRKKKKNTNYNVMTGWVAIVKPSKKIATKQQLLSWMSGYVKGTISAVDAR